MVLLLTVTQERSVYTRFYPYVCHADQLYYTATAMASSWKAVFRLAKSYMTLNIRACKSDIRHVPRQLKGRALHTYTHNGLFPPHRVTAHRNRRVLLAGTLFASLSAIGLSTSKAEATTNQTPRDPAASTLPLNKISPPFYNTTPENTHEAYEELKVSTSTVT
jgi:hypothetical protein